MADSRPTLVIMAAGAGSRFGGPKQLDPVGPGGARLLDYAVYDAMRAGIDRVALVVRPDLEGAFREAVRVWPDSLVVDIVTQRIDDMPAGAIVNGRTKPWGTTQAVLSTRAHVSGPLVVVNADDFYGRDAYRIAARHAASPDVTIVGMRLDRTLSPHGGVTRAVCRMRGDRVSGLDEVREIARGEDGRVRGRVNGVIREFTGHEVVSMNGWVLPHAVVARLAERFAAFVSTPNRAAEGECMLPETINELIARDEVSVRVDEAPGPWFGLTYAADRAAVMEGLCALTAAGAYAEKLWLGQRAEGKGQREGTKGEGTKGEAPTEADRVPLGGVRQR